MSRLSGKTWKEKNPNNPNKQHDLEQNQKIRMKWNQLPGCVGDVLMQFGRPARRIIVCSQDGCEDLPPVSSSPNPTSPSSHRDSWLFLVLAGSSSTPSLMKLILALGLTSVPLPLCKCGSTPLNGRKIVLWFWHLSSNSVSALTELRFSAKCFAHDFQPVQPSSTETLVLAETVLFDLVSRGHTQGNHTGQGSSARAKICLLHRKKWKIKFGMQEPKRAGLSCSCIARFSFRPSRICAAADVCPPYP